MKKRAIFEIWHKSCKDERNKRISHFILENHNISDLDKPPRELQVFVSSLSRKILAKWDQSKRTLPRFLAQHEGWLNEEISLPAKFFAMLQPKSSTVFQHTGAGRPEKPFEECTLKVKKRKINELVCSKTQAELTLAAEVTLRSAGKRDAADIVKELATASPSRATVIKKARKIFNTPEPKLSPELALALMVNVKLSSHQYNTLRQQLKSINSNIYPPYDLVKKAKLECYPPENSIKITEVSAEIELQAILDITVRRICAVQKDVFNDRPMLAAGPLRLISKWGCDGSSSQSQYKQKMENTAEYSDEHLFSITFVPLRLIHERSNTIIWQNPRANSTRFCRLIRFVLKKENKMLIKTETRQMKNQISNLVATKLEINNSEVKCIHELMLTMVDGKVCSALSHYDSSQKCYICGSTPKEMNTKTVPNTAIPENMYSFGISPLHSWIRAFECLLHISSKLDIKKWQAKSKEEKESVSKRKTSIQTQFRKEMGLLVDMPKQSVGNTNDGNSARTFFRNSEKSAMITGIDGELIYRFRVILEALSCDYDLDAKKFEAYALETKKKYLELYSWYYMPASIHKILTHSRKIIEACILPLGQLAEEAQEACNKEYRRFREHFSRKMTREYTNRDVLNRFLVSSDPLISSINKSVPRKNRILPQETISLLKTPEFSRLSSSDEEDVNTA